MFKLLKRLFYGAPEKQGMTININGVEVKLPPDVRHIRYRRGGNARLTFQSRPVQGNAKAA